MLEPITFLLNSKQLKALKGIGSNIGKNSHIGKQAVLIAKFYFQSIYNNPTFDETSKEADLWVIYDDKKEDYEIKGTTDPKIAFGKLKVSSQKCYDNLKERGQILLRICNIGKPVVDLYFMKYGKDFTMAPEDRWSVKRIKTT
jgi:hypothetical protein